MKRKPDRNTLYLVTGGFLILYLLANAFWRDAYLIGWLLHQKWYWLSMAICLGAAILGKGTFAITATAGFVLGYGLGELFGKPALPDACNSHYGWVIWLLIFLASLSVGGILQKHRT